MDCIGEKKHGMTQIDMKVYRRENGGKEGTDKGDSEEDRKGPTKIHISCYQHPNVPWTLKEQEREGMFSLQIFIIHKSIQINE